MVSESVVEEIRSRADLVDICGEHMSLKRVGKSVRGPCPLHEGDDPNFSIDPNRQIFKCFVCGEGGDVFSFVMKHLGLDFPEAVRHVGKRVGVEVPEEEGEGEDPHAGLRQVTAFAEEWFAGRLAEPEVGGPAREYLESRGIRREDWEDYALGYAPQGWRGLREAAHRHGIEDEALLEAGLLSTSERADEPYDRFRGRVVFSIQDLRDRPVGFGGRTLADDEDVPKYINSPDSPIFHKGRTLYALNWARHSIRKREHALVVEGYTDALSLHVRGRETAVAPLGTAMTEEQAEMLARYTRRAFLLYDSDAPGLRASFKAADNLLAAGVHPMVVTLPPDEDPDSLVRGRGTEALDELVRDAVDVVERKLQILERKGYLESIEGRRRAIDGLLSTLRAARDAALRDIYLDRVAERTGVRRATLEEEVARETSRARARAARRRSAGPGRPDRGGGSGSGEEDPSGATERSLLLLLLRDEEGEFLGRCREEELEPEYFSDPGRRELFRALLAAAGEGDGEPSAAGEGDLDPAAGVEEEDLDRAAREELDRLRRDETEMTDPERIFRHALLRLKNRPLLRRLEEIDRRLAFTEDDEEGLELLREMQEIVNELRAQEVPVSFLRRWSRVD